MVAGNVYQTIGGWEDIMGVLLTGWKGKQTIMMTFGNQHQHPCRICQQEQTTKVNKIIEKIFNVQEVYI